jgi:hypothetical protein
MPAVLVQVTVGISADQALRVYFLLFVVLVVVLVVVVVRIDVSQIKAF